MGKPLFAYRLYCETCGEELTRSSVPQAKVVIDEIRKDHANKHERGEL